MHRVLLIRNILPPTKVGFQTRFLIGSSSRTKEKRSRCSEYFKNPLKLCLRFTLSLHRMLPNVFSSHVTTVNQNRILKSMKAKEFISSQVAKQVVLSLIFREPGLKSTK